jgi:hypothetical protein
VSGQGLGVGDSTVDVGGGAGAEHGQAEKVEAGRGGNDVAVVADAAGAVECGMSMYEWSGRRPVAHKIVVISPLVRSSSRGVRGSTRVGRKRCGGGRSPSRHGLVTLGITTGHGHGRSTPSRSLSDNPWTAKSSMRSVTARDKTA